MSGGITSHERPNEGATNDWLTPPEVVADLGPFDLDPCASLHQPWATARQHYTIVEDGLSQRWYGFVWCNPPYGRHGWLWLDRLADHPNGGIALIFARTETRGFVEHVWPKATALRFLHGRLHFHHPDGTRAGANAGAPSVLVGYGREAARRLANSRTPGTYVALRVVAS